MTKEEALAQLKSEATQLASQGYVKGTDVDRSNSSVDSQKAASLPSGFSANQTGGIFRGTGVTSSEPAKKTVNAITAEASQLGSALGIQTPSNSSQTNNINQMSDLQNQIIQLQRSLTENQFQTGLSQIQADTNRSIQLSEQKQKQETGSARNALARMGALGTTSAGVQYLNDLGVQFTTELADIRRKGTEAATNLLLAKNKADIDLMTQNLTALKDTQAAKLAAEKAYYDNLKTVSDIEKVRFDNFSEKVGWMAKASAGGAIFDPSYLAAIDKEWGLPTGTTEGYLVFTESEAGLDNLKKQAEIAKTRAEAITEGYQPTIKQQEIAIKEQEIKQKEFEQMTKLQELLNTVPIGTEITIGDKSYTGRSIGDTQTYFETNETTGNAFGFVYNKSTGKWSSSNLGYVGKKIDGWETKVDDKGKMWRVNPKTNELMKFEVSAPTNIEKEFPEGTVWDNNGQRTVNIGQCGAYVNDLTGLKFGDTIQSKMALIDPTIGTVQKPIEIGDVIVQKLGSTGHVAIVKDVTLAPDGTHVFTLSEANIHGDGRVTHTRQLRSTDPTIMGFVRSATNPIKSGTDVTPTFPVGNAQKTAFEKETDIRKEIIGRADYKDFEIVTRNMGNMISSIENPITAGQNIMAAAASNPRAVKISSSAAGDIALVFSFMKMLDPNSTVREGEYATAASAGSRIPSQYWEYYNKLLMGGKLADSIRSEIIGTAVRAYTQNWNQFKSGPYSQYNKIIQDEKLDPSHILPNLNLTLPDGTVDVQFIIDFTDGINAIKADARNKKEVSKRLILKYPEATKFIQASIK